MKIVRLFAAALLLAASFASAAATLPRFDKLEQTLDLTPEQKEQYDVAVAATQRVVAVMALTGLEMKQRILAELAKPRPDLRVLAEARDELVERSRPLRRAAGDEWLKLYAMLNEDQIAVLRSFLEARLDRLGALHEFMLELMLGRTPSRKSDPYYW